MRVSKVLGVMVLCASLYSGSAAFAGQGYFNHGQGSHGQGSQGWSGRMYGPTPQITSINTKTVQNNGMSQTALVHGAYNEVTQVGIQTNTNVQPVINGF